MTDPNNYGQFYWCVQTERSPLSKFYAYADKIEITNNGTLILHREHGETHHPNVIIPSGKWSAVFAASLIDGHAVAIDRWEGEVDS